ncbi:MAG: 4-hydroxy-tetrahydrodipicolinate synthase [Pseudomonadota bacterium]
MSLTQQIYGSIPALATAMDANNAIDEKRFQHFVEWHIAQGSNALAPVGTTGESPTLTHAEHGRMIRLCVEATDGRVPVIAGTGSNNTVEAISLSQDARQAGADALLVVAPYYNNPSQRGLYLHFSAIARAVELPMIMYNIPGRSVVDLSVETMAQLHREFPHIIGVKDATGQLERPLETRLALGPDFIQLSGNDSTAVAHLAQGGSGCISVLANLAPALSASLHAAWRAGDMQEVVRLRDQLAPLHEAMTCEPSPAPVKYGLSLLGHMEAQCRLPIAPLSKAGQAIVRNAMEQVGLI